MEPKFPAWPSPPHHPAGGVRGTDGRTYQGRILNIVSEQPCVVEGVLGLLLHSIHGPLFHLVLDGLEELVEGLACAVLEQGGCVSGRQGIDKHSRPGGTSFKALGQAWGQMAPIHPPLALGSELTLRYWYRQMDIQLDSILSTTVSDLRGSRCLIFQGPAGSRSPSQRSCEQRALW